jgi:hypothetical protein
MSNRMRALYRAGALPQGFDDDDLEGPFDFLSGVPILGNIVSGVGNVAGGQPWGGSGQPAAAPAASSGGGGGLLGGILGGGGSAGGGPLGMISGLLPPGMPMPPMPPMPPGMPMMGGTGGRGVPLPSFVMGAGQGIDQALGTPAVSPFGSMFGAGLGGLLGGTGPLPDPFSRLTQHLYGSQGLPPVGAVDPRDALMGGDYNRLASHIEKAGRAIVNRVAGITDPQLSEIRKWLRERSAQIQATGEHRTIMNNQDFKAAVIEHLLNISRYLRVPGPGGVISGACGPLSTATAAAVRGAPNSDLY